MCYVCLYYVCICGPALFTPNGQMFKTVNYSLKRQVSIHELGLWILYNHPNHRQHYDYLPINKVY